MSYYDKYLKYKKKYLELKNNIDQTGGYKKDTLNFNIIVDVQNCFMMGGSFITNNTYKSNKLVDIPANLGQINEIFNLIDQKKDYTIFTRDYHPMGHSSIVSFNDNPDPPNTWQSHCLDRNTICMRKAHNDETKYELGDLDVYEVKDPRNRNKDTILTLYKYLKETDYLSLLPKKYYNVPINGSELSSIYFIGDNKYKYIKDKILRFKKPKDKKIRLNIINGGSSVKLSELQKTYNATKLPNIKPDITNIIIPKPQKFIELLKGQYCSYDSNSAFNYHYEYKTENRKIKMRSIAADIDNSTGLYEYILKCIKKMPLNTIEINVCGNVGNVCVIHTLLQGIVLLNKCYKKKFNKINVKFNFYMAGTRFAPEHDIKNPVIGGFNPVPTKDEIISKMKNYIKQLKSYAFDKDDLIYLKDPIYFYDYNLEFIDSIVLNEL